MMEPLVSFFGLATKEGVAYASLAFVGGFLSGMFTMLCIDLRFAIDGIIGESKKREHALLQKKDSNESYKEIWEAFEAKYTALSNLRTATAGLGVTILLSSLMAISFFGGSLGSNL